MENKLENKNKSKDFKEANLEGVNFSKAKLNYTTFENVNFYEASLKNVSFKDANLTNVDLTSANLTNVKLTRNQLVSLIEEKEKIKINKMDKFLTLSWETTNIKTTDKIQRKRVFEHPTRLTHLETVVNKKQGKYKLKFNYQNLPFKLSFDSKQDLDDNFKKIRAWKTIRG